jgi:hypothetical protein
MRNVNQTSTLKLLSIFFLALFSMVLLFSCSKNAAELTGQDKAELTVADASSPSSSRNSIVSVPFENTVFVPCANGGAGEDVLLNGYTAFVYQIVWNDHDFSLSYHGNDHHVTGVGLSSGESFVSSGGFEGTVMGSWVNEQWVGTIIRQLRIIGQNTVFTVNYKLQLIVTPDGKVTVSAREQTADCK